MNYFIDEAALEIKEKNIYTATETITALPFHGRIVFNKFLHANSWVKKYFPRYGFDKNLFTEKRKSGLKTGIEFLFNNKMGNRLDNYLMKITAKRWHRKTQQKKRNNNGVLLGMDSGKHFSKPLPGQMQEKVLMRFNLKMEQLMMELEAIRTASAV